MAYTRKAPKVDIRSLNVKSLTDERSQPVEPTERTHNKVVRHYHNPRQEIIRIAWCGAPLIIALVIGSYIELRNPWVVSFAEWLMKLGR